MSEITLDIYELIRGLAKKVTELEARIHALEEVAKWV